MTPQESGATTMRMVTFGFVLMATIVASAWSITQRTPSTLASPAGGPAAMDPGEMMRSTGEMPVHIIVDAF
jgi:hypothetical protein